MELDEEAHRSLRLDVVQNIRYHDARSLRRERHVCAPDVDDVAQSPFQDMDLPPHAAPGGMLLAQTGRNRAFREDRAGPVRLEVIRQFEPLAAHALQV